MARNYSKKKKSDDQKTYLAHRKLSEIIGNLEKSFDNMYNMAEVTTDVFTENLNNLIKNIQSEHFIDAKGREFYSKGIALLRDCAVYSKKKGLEDEVIKVFESYKLANLKSRKIFGKEYFNDLLNSKNIPSVEPEQPVSDAPKSP